MEVSAGIGAGALARKAGERLALPLAVLALLSWFTYSSEKNLVGFLLFPLPLLILGTSGKNVLWLLLCGVLFFFDPGRAATNVAWLGSFADVSDSALLWLLLALIARFSPPRFPGRPGALRKILGAFLLYAFAISLIQFFFPYKMEPLYYFRDVTGLVYLSLALLFSRDPELGPKNLVFLLLTVVVMSALLSLYGIWDFARQGGFRGVEFNQFGKPLRFTTYNEYALGDSVLIAVVLLQRLRDRRWRWILIASLPVCLLGMYVTLTRGIWLSTAGALLVYALMQLGTAAARRGSIGRIAMGWIGALLGIALVLGLLKTTADVDLYAGAAKRFSSYQEMELLDPTASLGYRIYESHRVWQERTWFGHGSGAIIRLWVPGQKGVTKTDWWSIHSEYFELLHKYGFVGLGLFLLFLAAAMGRAFRMAISRKGFTSALGYVVLLSLINHALISHTSGYFIRESSVVYLVLLVIILEKLAVRKIPRAPEHSTA